MLENQEPLEGNLLDPKSGNQSNLWENSFEDWDQWDEILLFLEDSRCILMLGPNISSSPERGKPYIELFSEELVKLLKTTEMDTSNFSKVVSNYKQLKTRPQFHNQVKKFYGKNLKPSESFKYIAKMPFPLIINTSPDHLLKEVYDNAIFDYYNFKSNRPEPTSSGTSKHPLIYNLFGSAVDPESLVITEKDRLDFLVNSIKRDPPLPKNLLNEKIMNNSNMFLFVGFDFNEWYLRLLLNILSLNNDRFACAIDRHDVETNQDARVFYTHNFNLSFLDAPFDIFIKKLYQKYTEKNPFLNYIKETAEGSSITIKKNEAFAPFLPEVIIIASMVDKSFVVELEKMLQPAVLGEKIKTWDGSKIKSGNVKEQLELRISQAHIIVICLSPDSLNYLLTNDLLPLLEKRQEQSDPIKIIPILYKKCQYQIVPYLSEQITYPKNALKETYPISALQEKADAYDQIADLIIKNIEN